MAEITSKCRATGIIALCFGLAGAASHALATADPDAEWSRSFRSPQAALTVPTYHVLPLPDGDFLVELARSSARFDAEGQASGGYERTDRIGELLGHGAGGLVLTEGWFQTWTPPDGFRCSVESPGPGLASRNIGGASAVDWTPGADGSLFLAADGLGLIHLDASCQPSVLAPADGTWRKVLTLADGASALVLSGEWSSHGLLQQVRADASVAWQLDLSARPLGTEVDMAHDGAAGMWVAGNDALDGRPRLMRVGADGDILWEHVGEGEASMISLEPMGGGRVALWSLVGPWQGAAGRAELFDADGELIGQHDLGPSDLVFPVRALDQPRAYASRRYPGGGDEGTRLFRLRDDGTLDQLMSRRWDEWIHAELAGGGFVVSDSWHEAPPTNSPLLVDPRTGSERPLELPARPVRSWSAGLEADAGGLAWLSADQAGRHRLQHLSVGGGEDWSMELAPGLVTDDVQGSYLSWQLQLLPDAACVTGERFLCFDRRDGSAFAPLEGVDPAIGLGPIVLESSQGYVLVYLERACGSAYACPTEIRRIRVPPGGVPGDPELLHNGGPGYGGTMLSASLPGKRLAYMVADGDGYRNSTLVVVDAELDAPIEFSVEAPGSMYGVAMAEDGSLAVAVGDGTDQVAASVLALDPDGSPRWSREAASYHVELEAVPGGWLQVEHFERRLRFSLLGANDGSPRWSFERDEPVEWFANSAELDQLHHAGNGRWAWLRPLDDGFAIEWRAIEDGRLLDVDEVEGVFLPQDIAGDGLGGLLTAGQRIAAGSTDAWLERRVGEAGTALPIDAGVAGMWMPPARPGQGFHFGVDAATGEVFGGWFTHAIEGEAGRAGLRWYTLQGRVADDGWAELDILRSEGGRFAVAPASETTVVGSARLRLQACDRALLDYRFDARVEQGAVGAMRLHRLLPADCASSGSGSGAFLDPVTPGQGLFLASGVASPAGADAGLWFTFDPEAADDEAGQHWFVLQPLPAGQQDEGFAFGIYRTVGGALGLHGTRNTSRVGRARIESGRCDGVVLRWRFDAALSTDPFRGRTGSAEMLPVAGCAGDG